MGISKRPYRLSFAGRLVEIRRLQMVILNLEDGLALNPDHDDCPKVGLQLEAVKKELSELQARDKRNHDESCLRIQKEYVDYVFQFPHHCPKCGGHGMVTWQENQSPLGSGQYWPETITDNCECVEEARCPRCGEEERFIVHEDVIEGEHGEYECEACGWMYGDDDGLPILECWCDLL